MGTKLMAWESTAGLCAPTTLSWRLGRTLSCLRSRLRGFVRTASAPPTPDQHGHSEAENLHGVRLHRDLQSVGTAMYVAVGPLVFSVVRRR